MSEISEPMQEIEAKFYVKDLGHMETRLRELKALLIQPRVHETNIRFDTPNQDLRREHRVLRLRQDDQIHLTYKGPSANQSGVLSRTEIEITVDDPERTRRLLEALGFEKSFFYEKYRTTYELDELHIMLDETPLGSFIEIESASADLIRVAAEKLGLKWNTAIAASYAALFERVRIAQNLQIGDMTFSEFKARAVSPRDLGVMAADE